MTALQDAALVLPQAHWQPVRQLIELIVQWYRFCWGQAGAAMQRRLVRDWADLICSIEVALCAALIVLCTGVSTLPREEQRPHIEVACDRFTSSLPQLPTEVAAAAFCLSLRSTQATEQQAVFSLIGSILVALTLVATAVASIYAAVQVTLARRSVFLEHRPWLVVKDVRITSDLVWSQDGGRLDFLFSLQNVGRTPATGVNVEAKLHIDWRVPAGIAQQAYAETLGGRPRHWGLTMFPGELRTFQHSLPIAKAEMDAHFDQMVADFGHPRVEMITLALIGAVTYGTVLDDEDHMTGFGFDIRRAQFTDPQTGQPSLAIGPNFGDVAKAALTLQLPWSDVVTT